MSAATSQIGDTQYVSSLPPLEPLGTPPIAELLFSIYSLLLEAVEIRQETILTQSKQLNDNTNIQQQLNQETNQIKYAVVGSGAKEDEITRVQNQNQNYSAQRSNIQDQLVTARQNGQIILSHASTNINIMQQIAQQNSSFIKTLNSVGSTVNQLNKPLS
ncbi:DUF720 domain-containing protein [Chlamydia trachomatis]|uniref:DUF720 domain-containing protein n=1 Tax=Chlamydia trachomatis serovar D (strain ATCC VR-885 / DSM 19411 / UW-3/Cx) TaxID=272561 RepID=O84856_CHLTR|nr:DUF720 domain-containing protein [Chlamydia trachomatis]NP_220370.1 hypothetical protein CT_849 [Chlamydia trachomatis D/UW-3/CX]AAC68446.1 hypothetical protein CT_849 [Chlamydia trachomatis D/UW-3/CX]ADH18580.1 hypothetical protein G9768_04520 [Chlamydia trachomatis G/9768]ADH19507.1 hypothetical protein G11222_04550 [Chlamydia trachomatis G/11222]ADH20426.1 hypothetical protein G11074_04515 [Chlamydia trachomatis G/11074]ADH97524.1 hypothetical protein CTG9301_04530 [Chlamydia trachomati